MGAPKEATMAQKAPIKKARKREPEELEELEELEEVADEAEDPEEELEEEPEGETLSAKEVANRLGVDARTFRKFLRSKFGKVGQGNRWLLRAEDFDTLKEQFEAYHRPRRPQEVTPDEENEPEDLEVEEDEFEDLDELVES